MCFLDYYEFLCLVGNKRAEIARVVPCENNFCTKYAHHLHFCGLQKLNTLNLRHFHPPLNPCNHFSTFLIKTNWYTISCKYAIGLMMTRLPNYIGRVRISNCRLQKWNDCYAASRSQRRIISFVPI